MIALLDCGIRQKNGFWNIMVPVACVTKSGNFQKLMHRLAGCNLPPGDDG